MILVSFTCAVSGICGWNELKNLLESFLKGPRNLQWKSNYTELRDS